MITSLAPALFAAALLTPARCPGSIDEQHPAAPFAAEGALAPENAGEARLNRIQPPDEVLRAVGLREGMVVGEIGAGRGRYTVQIAARVGQAGKVYANDIDAAALAHLRQRCARWGIANVETVLGRETDPLLPEGELDLLFMISTYHHISQPAELMGNARSALKPGGRLAIAEWVAPEGGDGRASQTPPQVLERQMKRAGYSLAQTIPFHGSSDSFNLYLFRLSDASGRVAFYSSRNGRDDIYLMGTDGDDVERATTGGYGGKCPDLSPDGTQIVFVSSREGNSDLYLLDIASGSERRLTDLPSVERQPKWSPDGRRIALQSNRDGNFEIYTMDADGGGWQRLTSTESEELWPSWSPDGAQIVFSSSRDGNWELYLVNSDGSNLRRLTFSDRNETGGSWSPDGTRIAFRSGPPGQFQGDIHVIEVDGSGERQLTDFDGVEENPVWSPDGSRIAFQTMKDGNFEIYVMEADGSNLRNLTNHPANDYWPSWVAPATASAPSVPAGPGDGGARE